MSATSSGGRAPEAYFTNQTEEILDDALTDAADLVPWIRCVK
jgi:hypothetical protein